MAAREIYRIIGYTERKKTIILEIKTTNYYGKKILVKKKKHYTKRERERERLSSHIVFQFFIKHASSIRIRMEKLERESGNDLKKLVNVAIIS